MKPLFWVTALAVLSITRANNSTAKTTSKRQLDSIRSPENLQYSLVLPHSKVAHFRSVPKTRRISHAAKGKLPPYAVQMEPVVQYSQKDPLYDPTHKNLDEAVESKNEIHAQSKILNVEDLASESSAQSYKILPTAPLYSHEPHPHYYDYPEPIIEIIIKESNESVSAAPPPPIQKKKKEPVHVFYVKYSKDPHSKDKIIYEKPIPAITPPTNDEDDDHDQHDEYITVTPEPHVPSETTTLRAIIRPDSEIYHSDGNVRVTFGNEGRHYSDRREGNAQAEDFEASAPKPAIALPNQPLQFNHPPIERSASPKPQFLETSTGSSYIQGSAQSFRPESHFAQSRIQFQPQYSSNNQQLPKQIPSVSPFRPQSQTAQYVPFGPTPTFNAAFSNGPIRPASHFRGPTVPSPTVFSTAFPRTNSGSNFHSHINQQSLASRQQFNGPPRINFQSGSQRPFPSQSKNYFDDPKYLQENYHTITTEQVDPPKHQVLPNRHPQNFNNHLQSSPSPTATQFLEHRRPSVISLNQQLPQQRPHQKFAETIHSKPPSPISPSTSPFFNLKPSPPHLEENRPPFNQQSSQHSSQHQSQQQFSFHQGPQTVSIPSTQTPIKQNSYQHTFPAPRPLSQTPIPQTQFVPQPSTAPLFNYHPQPSPTPEVFNHQVSPSETPQFQQSHGPSERPYNHQNNFQSQSIPQHFQNIGSLVPNGGEFIPAISKYEQHITVNGPTAESYSGLSNPRPSHPIPTTSQPEPQYHQNQEQQKRQQQKYHETEQEQVRQQLAENVKKQQDEIQRLQTQLLYSQQQQQQQQQQQHEQQHQQQLQHQQQHQQQQQHRQQQQQQNEQQESQRYHQPEVQHTSQRSQYFHDRLRQHPSSTVSPSYYQSTSRTVEIKPTTRAYDSSTQKSTDTTSEPKKKEQKKNSAIELPDEVPDDLRQQLLSSGILDNADISVLDYDKVGDTPLESLPPDQLANFFGAGGGQQIASSENRPVYVKPNGGRIESRIDDEIDDDQEFAASENIPNYVAAPSLQEQAVEMKVVHFDPETAEGKNLAKEYIKENATQIEPVALNDKKYHKYLPLTVSGNQFPLPDILKGRKITSVVVLAPVETEALVDHSRTERAASDNLKGIKFVAGESLQELLRQPTKDNFQKWLEIEKKTTSDLQSVILLVTGDDKSTENREIFMYDVASGNVNKLSGELSNAFVEAAENNSLSKDIESLAIEGEGVPENFDKDFKEEIAAEGSENVPLFVDVSGISLNKKDQVSITSGYSKTKHGRSLRIS